MSAAHQDDGARRPRRHTGRRRFVRDRWSGGVVVFFSSAVAWNPTSRPSSSRPGTWPDAGGSTPSPESSPRCSGNLSIPDRCPEAVAAAGPPCERRRRSRPRELEIIRDPLGENIRLDGRRAALETPRSRLRYVSQVGHDFLSIPAQPHPSSTPRSITSDEAGAGGARGAR